MTKAIEIIWHDAHSEGVSGGTWFDKADIDSLPYIVRSIGVLVPEVKAGHVTLAQSVAITDGLLDSVLHIPLPMIQEMRELT